MDLETMGRRALFAAAVFAAGAARAQSADAGEAYRGSAPWHAMARRDGRALGGGDPLVVEFLDYNCGFCRLAHAAMPSAMSRLPGVSLLRADLPILSPSSLSAAFAVRTVSLSGGGEGRLHDRLMERRGTLTDNDIADAAAQAGLRPADIARDMSTPGANAAMRELLDVARATGLRATPSYVTRSGRLLTGFGTPQRFIAFMAEERR